MPINYQSSRQISRDSGMTDESNHRWALQISAIGYDDDMMIGGKSALIAVACHATDATKLKLVIWTTLAEIHVHSQRNERQKTSST